jgi:phosphoribosylformylglycinamidine synthase
VSGNVSFYNESFGQAIYPTPMIGMLGIYDDVSVHIDGAFKEEGDVIVLLGPPEGFVDGAEYQKVHYGRVEGRVPDVDLALEVRLQAAVRDAVARRLLKSAHDCAEGGLAVALAESAIASGAPGGAQWADPAMPKPERSGRWLGADVAIGAVERPDLALFGEAPSRVVITCAPADLEAVRELAGELPFAVLGVVTGEGLRCTMGGEELLALPVSELHGVYESLPDRLA